MVGAELRKVERARIAGLVGARVARLARVNVRSEAAGINEAVTAGIAERELCIRESLDEMIAENSRDHAAMLLEAYGPVPPVVKTGQGEFARAWNGGNGVPRGQAGGRA